MAEILGLEAARRRATVQPRHQDPAAMLVQRLRSALAEQLTMHFQSN